MHILGLCRPHSTPLELILFSIISSLATGHITPQCLLPTQLTRIVNELAAQEFQKKNRLTSATPSKSKPFITSYK